jgi:hypothetical protein
MDQAAAIHGMAPGNRGKATRAPKANAFKQELARAMEGAGPPATEAALRGRGGGLAAQTASAALALQAARPAGGAMRPADAAFRDRIAASESSVGRSDQGYGARNPASGALGRYQFLAEALRDMGWKDAQDGWTGTAARHGVRSDADFLANPAAQEAAMDGYLRRAEQQLDRNGSLAQAGTTLTGLDGQALRLTEAGLVAAAHRRGAGSVARYLAHRSATPEAAVTPQQRSAFAAVERRLREFAETPYTLASRAARGTSAA